VDLPGQSKEKTSSQADVISVLFQMETAKEPVPVHKVESSDDEASREPIPSSILQHKKVDYGSKFFILMFFFSFKLKSNS